MVDLVTGVAILLLLVAVVGSLVPLVPAGLTALAGVYVYYFFARGGGESMGLWLLAGFTVLGLVTALVEHFGGPLASKAGGAETETMILAGLASVLLLFVLGPLGVVVGVVTVVVLAELRAGKGPREAAVASAWTVAGLLGSTVAQLLLTLSMLVGFVTFVILLS